VVPIYGGGGAWWKSWLCGGVVGREFDYAVTVGVGVGLMMDMVERGFLSILLLANDIDRIL
jgi:hypothetical protein